VVRAQTADGTALEDGVLAIQRGLGLDPGFPPDVLEAAAGRPVIANMAAFVVPDGPIDREAHRRGETLCGADPGSRCTRRCCRRAPSRCCRGSRGLRQLGQLRTYPVVHHAPRSAGEVLVRDHAIETKVHGSEPLPLGEEISVRLVGADVATRVVRFESVTG
jgi:hypothetical protein